MTRRISVTRKVAVGATLALTAGLGWVGTGAASAATPLASCAISGSAAFTPSLSATATPTSAKLTGTLTGCTGKSGVKSGTFTGTMNLGPQTCGSMLAPPRPLATAPVTIKWKGGTTSVVNATLAIGSGDFSLGGPVTKNRFKGHKCSAPHLKPTAVHPVSTDCSKVQVQSLDFSGTSRATVN
jgi:hypothetical protein